MWIFHLITILFWDVDATSHSICQPCLIVFSPLRFQQNKTERHRKKFQEERGGIRNVTIPEGRSFREASSADAASELLLQWKTLILATDRSSIWTLVQLLDRPLYHLGNLKQTDIIYFFSLILVLFSLCKAAKQTRVFYCANGKLRLDPFAATCLKCENVRHVTPHPNCSYSEQRLFVLQKIVQFER